MGSDSTIATNSTFNYNDFLNLLAIIKWPIVVLFLGLIIFFVIRKSLIGLIGNIKRIKYGDLDADTVSKTQQEAEKKPILGSTIDNVEDPQQQNHNVHQLSIVDRGLAMFHNYTINKVVTQVENETQVAEIHNISAKYCQLPYNSAI